VHFFQTWISQSTDQNGGLKNLIADATFILLDLHGVGVGKH
jgi:hypothetical protein